MIEYTKGYKYQLHSDAEFQLDFYPVTPIFTDYLCFDIKGHLFIKAGYAWDGPSGPTIDTKDSMQGSLVHDALYQLMRMRLLPQTNRIDADNELKMICIGDGMWIWRAKIWWLGVRNVASSAADPKNRKKVYTAP